MADHELVSTYQAMARAWDVGAEPAKPNKSPNSRVNNDAVILPDVGARMKAIAKKWNGDQLPEGQKLLPGQTADTPITTAEAIWHIAEAKLLTAEPSITIPFINKTFQFRSAAEAGEGFVLSKQNALNRASGLDIPVESPTPEKLGAQVESIKDKFAGLLGPRFGTLPTPGAISEHIHAQTVKRVHTSYQEPVGKFERPNKAEEIVAAQLGLMIGSYDALEISEVLRDMVFAQIADMVLANQQAAFSRVAPGFNTRYEHLQREKPSAMYYAPWLTTEVMIPASQQPTVENTSWTLSPTKLAINRVIMGNKEDKPVIELANIDNPLATNNTIVADGTLPYVDHLKVKGTRFLAPLIDRLIGPNLGGIVVLRRAQAPTDPLTLAVPNAPAAKDAIVTLAKLNQDALAIKAMVNSSIMQAESPLKEPIRPQMIRHMLPPLALDRTLNRTAGGDINYGLALEMIHEDLNKQNEILRTVEIGVARDLARMPRNISWDEAQTLVLQRWLRPLDHAQKKQVKLSQQEMTIRELLKRN